MKKFKPIKVKNGSVRLPDEFLDQLLVNDGDFLLIAEEDGRFYIRKTRDTSPDSEEPETSTEQAPKTFDEIMREAQKQFGGDGNIAPDDLMKSIQDTLQDPEMMKKIQDMAMGFFKGFAGATGSPQDQNSTSNKSDSPNVPKKKSSKKKNDDDKDDDNEDDDDSSDSGFKINIE